MQTANTQQTLYQSPLPWDGMRCNPIHAVLPLFWAISDWRATKVDPGASVETRGRHHGLQIATQFRTHVLTQN